MTEIDVPDWVVEVAMAAGEKFASENTVSMYATVRDLRREEMRTSITAALGAWVVPVGYASRKALAAVSTPPFYGCDTYISAEEQTIVACEPLYALRQEKPE